MDPQKFKYRIQRRMYHHGCSEKAISTTSLPLTEVSMEYFQDSFDGSEGLGRLDMPMTTAITKKNKVSPCSVVLSMLYAKRLRQGNRDYLQSMSSTDVFFISMMMASKYLYDEGVDEEVYNDEWADSIGHDVNDVNKMEMDFLTEMDWQLFVKPQEFDCALTAVERRLALREGMKRGWFTYTEMGVLLDWDPVYQMWSQFSHDCTKVVSVMSAVYVASLLSMMGSAAIAFQLSVPMATATVSILSLHRSLSFGNILPFANNFLFQPDILAASDRINEVNSSLVVPLPISADVVDFENHKDGRILSITEPSWVSDNTDLDSVASPSQRKEDNSESELDNVDEFEKECDDEANHSSNVKGVSVLSMLFFDSLLSQICSIYTNRRPKNCCVISKDVNDSPEDFSLNENSADYDCSKSPLNGNVCQCLKSSNQCLRKRNDRRCKKFQSRKQLLNHSISDPTILDNGAKFQTVHEENLKSRINFEELVESETKPENNWSVKNDPTSNLSAQIDKNHLTSDSNPSSSNHLATSFNKDPTSLPLTEHSYHVPTLHPQLKSTFDRNIKPTCQNHGKMNSRHPQCQDETTMLQHLRNMNKREVDLGGTITFPESLTADVPILDPIGFFTKTSGPSYVLGT